MNIVWTFLPPWRWKALRFDCATETSTEVPDERPYWRIERAVYRDDDGSVLSWYVRVAGLEISGCT